MYDLREPVSDIGERERRSIQWQMILKCRQGQTIEVQKLASDNGSGKLRKSMLKAKQVIQGNYKSASLFASKGNAIYVQWKENQWMSQTTR